MKKLKAAILIQSNIRGLIQRRNYQRTRQLVIGLQTTARARHCQKNYRQLKDATILLQRRVRASLAARKERREFLEAKRATVNLQSCYRGWKARCFVRKVKALLLIQRWFRAHVAGMKAREEYHKVKEATVVLQSAYRGYCGRMFARRMRAARTIQSAVKGLLTRKRIGVSLYFSFILFG